jgi:hypothetical protein
VVYWLNLLLLGALLFAGRRYSARAGLVREDVTAEMLAAGERRIVVYQASMPSACWSAWSAPTPASPCSCCSSSTRPSRPGSAARPLLTAAVR